MRTFFTSFVIREMQVETTGYHFTARRMAQIENLTTLNPDMDQEQVELSPSLRVGCKMASHPEGSLMKLDIHLPLRSSLRFWLFIR